MTEAGGVFDALRAWPRWEPHGYPRCRAMVKVDVNIPPVRVLKEWMAGLAARDVARDVAPELQEAARRLQELPLGAVLGRDGTADATEAVHALARRLEERTSGEDPAAAALLVAVRGDGLPVRRVAEAMRAFAQALYAAQRAQHDGPPERRAIPTFSLILAPGEAAEISLRARVGAWRRPRARPARPTTTLPSSCRRRLRPTSARWLTASTSSPSSPACSSWGPSKVPVCAPSSAARSPRS